MATTKVRDKKAPRPKKGKALEHPCESILVRDLRVGMEIGTVFAYNKYNQKVITKSFKVERIEECPSMWRTHIHVNAQSCYDMRQSVTVKKG